MDRIELLEKLNKVSPGLSGNDLIPMLSHFWFTGTRVMTFNDQIAISTTCKTDFTGAVPGNTLLNLLKASKARDVEMLLEGDNLQIKAASSRFRLGTIPLDNTLFEMPEAPKVNGPFHGTPQFLEALDACMRSVSLDTSVPDQLGVTLVPDGGTLLMYATNGHTISHCRIKLKDKATFTKRVILSTPFCQQVLKLGGPGSILAIHDDHALLITKGTMLFGRLVESEKPLDFAKVTTHHFPPELKKRLITIPSKLRLILERACIITEAKIDHTKTTITVRDGKMRFVSRSDRGEVVDTMLVTDHPEVSIMVDPKPLKAGFGFFDTMLVTEKCIIMCKGDMVYLVAGTGE